MKIGSISHNRVQKWRVLHGMIEKVDFEELGGVVLQRIVVCRHVLFEVVEVECNVFP
jgi:tetrahydromethanopterin S-methyltransferase subunit H